MLEKTTVNATGFSWVDNVPSAVSTGYQAQNVAAEAVRVGVDTIVIEACEDGGLVVKQGGTIEENEFLYTVKSDQVISVVGNSSAWYFALKVESGGNRSIEAITKAVFETGSFIPERNAFYTSDNRRILGSFAVPKYYDSVLEIYFYSVFRLENGYTSLSKFPISNNYFELLDYNAFEQIKKTCGCSHVYNFPSLIGLTQDDAGCSFERYLGSDARVFVAGKNSMVYALHPKSGVVDGISLASHFTGVSIRGIAYIHSVSGYDTPLLAVSTSDQIIRLFQYVSSVWILVETIDMSPLVADLWDIEFVNGELYSSSGTKIYHHAGLTNLTFVPPWDIETKYFCMIGGSNAMFDPLNLVGSIQDSFISKSAFHRSIYFYQRLTDNSRSNLFRFRFSGMECFNIAEGEDLLMSFDPAECKLYVQ